MTRTIEVPIPDDLLQLVDERARRSGLKREDNIRTVLSREVTGAPSISEILVPFANRGKPAASLTRIWLGSSLQRARNRIEKEIAE